LLQEFGCLPTHLSVADPYGRQGRIDQVHQWHVVVSNNRNILGALEAPLAQDVVSAERKQVVRSNDRREFRVLVEQAPCGACAFLAGVGASALAGSTGCADAVQRKSLFESLSAQEAGGVFRWSGEVADFAVSKVKEVIDRKLHAQ